MIDLSLDSAGWPIWPPNDPSIFESIRKLWETQEWGKYHSAIHSQCVQEISRLMSLRLPVEIASNSPWHPFSDRLSQPIQVRLCSSGTAGIELALRCSGVTAGSEVVLAAHDYPGNFRTIELLGATPVLAEVAASGVTMDPKSLRLIEGDSIKTVIVSHLYGELADMLSIRRICDERNWTLIEDACQVPGAGWRSDARLLPEHATKVDGSVRDDSSGEAIAWDHSVADDDFIPVGALADVTVLSFGGSKLLSAGNGGTVITRNDRLAARLRGIADRPSDTYAFSPLQCAALIPQLAMLNPLNQQRAEMAKRLRQWAKVPTIRSVPEQINAYYKFAILADNARQRSDWLNRMREIALPIGEGFRSLHATSAKRSRKPVSLDRAAGLSERLLVLDHRALLARDLIKRLDAVF